MEKRLLLAAGLSFLVLFIWYTVIAPPQKAQNTIKNSQLIENKKPEAKTSSEAEDQVAIDFVEEKHIWKTERFNLEFTNRGGNLSRVVLMPYEQVLPINNILSVVSLDNKEFILKESARDVVVYVYEQNEIYFKKEYKINKDNGLLMVSISGEGLFDQKRIKAYDINMSILGDYQKIPHFNEEKSLFEYVVNSGGKIFRRAKAFQFSSEKNDSVIQGMNDWTGFRNRYYCAILKPGFELDKTVVETISKENLGVYWDVSRETSKNSLNFSTSVYFGPEDKETLKSFGFGFEKIKRFYTWAIFEWPARFIYYVMHGIHKFIPVWGLCILLISLMVYLATYPLTLKSMTSMRKMQQIQPEVAALKDKYKDNPQQMNTEMMAIYHRYNINPVSGCLPMLLQMPVFIGLYQVLWRDVDFKGQKFLWIKDLSEPDRFFVFSQNLPLVGHDFNLLPLLMVVIMFFQQRLSLKSVVVTDETQLMQQKMMMYLMPALLGVIFYKFSSGLTLYFVIFYLMSTLTQWKFSLNNGKKS